MHRYETDCRRFDNPALLIFFLIALVLSGPSLVFADNGLSVTATAGFDGLAKVGHWAPVTVDIKNSGAEFVADIAVEYHEPSDDSTVQYVERVLLSSGSHKRVRFYVPTKDMSRAINVKVSGAGEPVKTKAKVTITGYNEIFVGVLSSDPGAMRHLAGLKFPESTSVRVLRLDADDIPEKTHLLLSLDALILADYDSAQLSDAQTEAIEGYVSLGRALVVSGGPNWQKTLATLPESLMPVKVSGSANVHDMPNLSALGGTAFTAPGPYTVSTGTPDELSETVCTDNGIPTIVTKRIGQGLVEYWALDLTLEPVSSWMGNQVVWEREIERLVPWALTGYTHNTAIQSALRMESGQIPWALRNLPNFVVPSTRTLGLLLFAYVMLIGPLNYLVLRRLKRVELTWITVPVIVLVLGAGTYVAGFKANGINVFTNTISVARVDDDGNGMATTFMGVFAPTKQNYGLVFEGTPEVTTVPMYFGRYMDPLSEPPVSVRIIHDNDIRIEFPSMTMWSMQAISFEERVALGEGLVSELVPNSTGLKGTVQNLTGHNLTDCVVLAGNSYFRMGDLPAGASADVELKIDSAVQNVHDRYVVDKMFDTEYASNPWDTDTDMREAARKRQVLSAAMGSPYEPTQQSYEICFVGWVNSPLVEVLPKQHEGGREPYLGLVVAPLKPTLKPGEVSYPPGLITASLIEGEDQLGLMRMKMGPDYFFLEPGCLDFGFVLPKEIESVHELALHLPVMSGASYSVQTSLLNWTNGEWEEVALGGGENSVKEPARFVSPTGEIHFKVENTGSTPFEIRSPSLSLSGRVGQ